MRLMSIFLGVFFLTNANANEPTSDDSTVLHDVDTSLRLRYTDVQQPDDNGAALSALLRVTWRASWAVEWDSVIETDFVVRGLRDQHSDGVVDNHEPVVPDPAGADLNQAFIAGKFSALSVQLGRQRIEHSNQRFVGGNSFWQNEQTFDAVALRVPVAESSRFEYAFVYNVNRIFGEKASAHIVDGSAQYGEVMVDRPFSRLGDHSLRSHWLHGEWREWDFQRIDVYFYDNEYVDFASWSHRMAGVRHEFDYKFEQWRWRTQMEAAFQDRYDVNDAKPTRYSLVDVAFGQSAWEAALRVEVLGSRRGISFIAPLGSAHDFHGVVGKFSGTPANGLQEMSARINWRQAPWFIELRQATYKAADGRDDFGDEIDLIIRWRHNRQQSLIVSAGDFRAAHASLLSDERRVYVDYRYEF